MASKTKITFYGQSMFIIGSENGTKIGMDPYDTQVKSILPDVSADVVTISHSHFDHSNVALFKGNPEIIKEPITANIKGIQITGLAAFHDNIKGGLRGKNIIFKFEVDSIKFAHLGDYGSADEKTVSELKNMDIIFIPVGGIYTIDYREAIKLIKELKPKIAIPMHFREKDTHIGLDDITYFKNNTGSFNKIKEIDKSFEINKAELPSDTEIWIMYSS
ncbi:MAG: MBL fold metallo-hydrolase [Actinobacteria bacterium]|nr:MBL fold metallo-hydrolase [Actinomycetota bacterium]